MKTKLENVNEGSNYILACIKCGTMENIHMTAHRNEGGNICGLLNVCDECHEKILNCSITIEKNTDSTSES